MGSGRRVRVRFGFGDGWLKGQGDGSRSGSCVHSCTGPACTPTRGHPSRRQVAFSPKKQPDSRSVCRRQRARTAPRTPKNARTGPRTFSADTSQLSRAVADSEVARQPSRGGRRRAALNRVSDMPCQSESAPGSAVSAPPAISLFRIRLQPRTNCSTASSRIRSEDAFW